MQKEAILYHTHTLTKEVPNIPIHEYPHQFRDYFLKDFIN